MRSHVADLKPNPDNPRKITKSKLQMLKRSLEEFGDLSGFVFNRTTGQLVGGHQRARILAKADVIIEVEYAKPTKNGTVVDGYVSINGERFGTYREVEWDVEKQKAATIAANKGAGEWEPVALSEWLKDLDSFGFDLDLTMFDDVERLKILADDDEEDDEPKAAPERKAPKLRCQVGDKWQLGSHVLICGEDDTHYCDVILTRWENFTGKKAQKLVTKVRPANGQTRKTAGRKNAKA
jgi:hypothetical protein